MPGIEGVPVATQGLLGNIWGEGVGTGAKTRSGAAAAERSAEPDTAPRATAGGWRGREQTPDERVGSRQPQTSDHCRLQLQDAQTQNVAARAGSPSGVSEPREHNGSSASDLTTLRTGSHRVSPGPGSSPARANGAPRVGQGPPDVP